MPEHQQPAQPAQQQDVRVGVGVLIRDADFKVICGIRKGSHGAGSLALPGGHLEMMEGWDECARREVMEETNLNLPQIEWAHVTNDPMPTEGKHYVTIFMMACCQEGQVPQTMEPDKCEGWKAYSWEELEAQQAEGKLFGPLDRLVRERPAKVLEFLNINK